MKLSRVEIITSTSKIEKLKNSIARFGISGMTVFQAMGCGVQLGTKEYEAEQNEEPSLLPKEMVMLIVPTERLNDFLEFVKKELYTGHIGDGKIFISEISNIVRVRTGEEGYDALISGKD
ncbi:MAG TPA: hypothetical protein DEP23_05415 [Ruminococcaceae bacterium]|jgi:nitrogen regulatory protein PII|nr:hypothetical protein [Oscillospiraceae bacterium]